MRIGQGIGQIGLDPLAAQAPRTSERARALFFPSAGETTGLSKPF